MVASRTSAGADDIVRRRQYARQLMRDYPVDVFKRDLLHREQLGADALETVIFEHDDRIGRLVEMGQREHGIIVLDDHLAGRIRPNNLQMSTKS